MCKRKYRFHYRIVPVTGDGNCLFRTLSHLIFVDESEYHYIRGSLIDTFEQNPYVAALCGLKGNNAVSIQQHLDDLRRNYSWGTVNELIMFGILARINGIPNDPILGGKSIIVLFHSIPFSGPFANHYDAIYRLQ